MRVGDQGTFGYRKLRLPRVDLGLKVFVREIPNLSHRIKRDLEVHMFVLNSPPLTIPSPIKGKGH